MMIFAHVTVHMQTAKTGSLSGSGLHLPDPNGFHVLNPKALLNEVTDECGLPGGGASG